MIGPALRTQLMSLTAVTSLLGSNGDIRPNVIKEPEKWDANGYSLFPQVAYDAKDPEYDITYSGNSGLAFVEITVTVAAQRYLQCETLAQAIVTALDQQSGVWGGVTVQGCWFKGWEDEFVQEPASQQIVYHVKAITLEVAFNLF